MKTINFATSNMEKLLLAQTVADKAGIKIKQVKLAIDEIQGEEPEIIVRDKVKKAYDMFSGPVVVSDDTWDIPALKGFPGPYMKSIKHWFDPDDFIRLMTGVKDRRAILHQFLAYYDGKQIVVFKNDIPGKIINEARGKNLRSPNTMVTVLDADNGKTIAEIFELGEEAVLERYRNRNDVWHEFIDWYRNR